MDRDSGVKLCPYFSRITGYKVYGKRRSGCSSTTSRSFGFLRESRDLSHIVRFGLRLRKSEEERLPGLRAKVAPQLMAYVCSQLNLDS
jgi:hypothetical protein